MTVNEMVDIFISCTLSLSFAGAVFLSVVQRGPRFLSSYVDWWRQQIRFLRWHLRWQRVPELQFAVGVCLSPATAFWSPPLFGVLLLSMLVPPLFVSGSVRRRRSVLAADLDGMLTHLSNALSTRPSLLDALRGTSESAMSPLREELEEVLFDVRLGSSLDAALLKMSERIRLPGVESFVAAAIMGRRTGGNLCRILKETAAALREISRLEEVVKTRTAEGRNQALVMGLVPPFLVVTLHLINPDWLGPMWRDPIGWGLVGLAVILELSAVVLIRKITAVDV